MTKNNKWWREAIFHTAEAAHESFVWKQNQTKLEGKEIVDHISYHHPFREKREDKLTGPPPRPPLQIQVGCPRFDCECSQSRVYLESPKSTSHPPCPNRAKCKRQLLSFSFALGFSLFQFIFSFLLQTLRDHLCTFLSNFWILVCVFFLLYVVLCIYSTHIYAILIHISRKECQPC